MFHIDAERCLPRELTSFARSRWTTAGFAAAATRRCAERDSRVAARSRSSRRAPRTFRVARSHESAEGADCRGGRRPSACCAASATARANAHDDSDDHSLSCSACCVRSSPSWSSRAQRGFCPIAADFELT